MLICIYNFINVLWSTSYDNLYGCKFQGLLSLGSVKYGPFNEISH